MKLPNLNLQSYEEYKNFNINEVLEREYIQVEASESNLPKIKDIEKYLVINVLDGIPVLEEKSKSISLIKEKHNLIDTTNPFVNLNYSYNKDEYIINITSTPNKPVLIVNYYTVKSGFIPSNLKIIIGDGVNIDILETNISDNEYLAISNRTIVINNGSLNYTRKDGDNNLSNLIYNYNVEINSGTFNSVSLNKDGNVNINNWLVNLNKKDSKTNIYGIIQLNQKKRHGSVCVINHNDKETYSIQEFRHILDDNSYAMYHGDTVIKNGSINSNASQNSKAIMLSDSSRILNKPRLNVFTGEVKATHGATVGRFNNEDIFYLKQRGISEKEIKVILIKAFITDIIDKIKSDTIRGYLYD